MACCFVQQAISYLAVILILLVLVLVVLILLIVLILVLVLVVLLILLVIHNEFLQKSVLRTCRKVTMPQNSRFILRLEDQTDK